MTVNNKSRRLMAVLAMVLSVIMLLSLATVSVFAEETTTEAATTEAATTGAATTEAATTGAATTGEAKDEGMSSETLTRIIINSAVGVVILGVAVVLCIVFRKKIPGWWRGLKSECGKVVWCPKDKLKKNAFVVIVVIIIMVLVIALLDFAFSRGIMLLRQLIKG